MTADERKKSNAEISSIYKRKVEEARTATELPSSETTEVTDSEGDGESGKDGQPAMASESESQDPKLIEDGQVAASSEDGNQTPAVAGTKDDQGSSKGAYQMLKNQEPIRLLVVGDSIAAGKGASQKPVSWPELLADGLGRRFGSQVTMTNASMDHASTFATYAEVMGLAGEEGQDGQASYDMVIICCGRDDSENGFAAGYEAVIRAVHQRYPDCTILSVREHGIEKDSVMAADQKKINKAYHVAAVDMNKAFAGQEDQLTDGSGYPNDAGHKKYAQSLFAVIHELVEKDNYEPVPDIEPLMEGTDAYDNYSYYGADQFEKTSKLSYQLKTAGLRGMLGIDYYAYDGDESVTLDLDDQSFALTPMELDGAGQRVIRLIKSNFTVKDKITVTFKDKDQADKFQGLIVTGK